MGPEKQNIAQKVGDHLLGHDSTRKGCSKKAIVCLVAKSGISDTAVLVLAIFSVTKIIPKDV